MRTKIKIDDFAVAEIIGAILLLAMAVAAFSVIYINVLSDDGPAIDSYATILGKIETGDVVFEHNRGEGISTDSIISLFIAGDPVFQGKISDLPDFTGMKDDIWRIGEHILYTPDEPLNGPDIKEPVEVKAYIFDKLSNSMVFWGTLQEGYVGGKGGVWHFNESSWDKDPTTLEVIDSLNGNNGSSCNDADTTGYVVNTAINAANRSGYFNFTDGTSDFVIVPNAYSLNIRNQITMEAWIKPKNFFVNTGAPLENKFGMTPYITNISKNIYVVVSEDQFKGGIIQTFSITPSGGILGNEPLCTYEGFGKCTGSNNLRPVVYHVIDDIYVVAYMDGDLHITLKTFSISSDGLSITPTGEKLVFNDKLKNPESNRPSVLKVSKGVFAIAYRSDIGGRSPGSIKTVNISDIGAFYYTGNNITFDYDRAYEPSIINIDGDVFAIVYRGPWDQGIIKRFKISYDDIQSIGINTTFDYDRAYEPSIINIDGDVFAIVYRGSSDQGIIKRFKISDDYIQIIGINTTFESSSCFNPCIINLSKNHYVIVFSEGPSGDPDGYYKTIEISDNGDIMDIGSKETFVGRCLDPIAINISENIFAVVYEGHTAHLGNLKTIFPKFLSDELSTGIINKYESYGIYANSTKVVAYINKNKIEASIVPEIWQHIILTYDGYYMRLYVNGTQRGPSIWLNKEIKITNNDLTFGKKYYGYIDEIAIFDYVISDKDISDHSNPNIGIWSFY